MKTTANFFNFVEMLKLEHDEVNNIAAQNFTLDELDEFERFLYVIGKAYNAPDIEKMHNHYLYTSKSYTISCNNASMSEIESADWLDEDFMNLKLQVEEMAALLVFDTANGFFSEARR